MFPDAFLRRRQKSSAPSHTNIKLQRTLLRQFNPVCLLRRLTYIDKAPLSILQLSHDRSAFVYRYNTYMDPAMIISALIISEQSTEIYRVLYVFNAGLAFRLLLRLSIDATYGRNIES